VPSSNLFIQREFSGIVYAWLMQPHFCDLRLRRGRATASVLASLMVLLLVVANTATAASIRCSNTVVSEGLHMFEVSQYCGTPIAEFRRIEYLHPQVFIYVDEWVYQFGTSKFQRLLRFENGRLQSIKVLDKPRADQIRGNSRLPAALNNAIEHRISY